MTSSTTANSTTIASTSTTSFTTFHTSLFNSSIEANDFLLDLVMLLLVNTIQ